ncbi:hypothetical protein ACN47E_000259 [Coniothyrium glycines]
MNRSPLSMSSASKSFSWSAIFLVLAMGLLCFQSSHSIQPLSMDGSPALFGGSSLAQMLIFNLMAEPATSLFLSTSTSVHMNGLSSQTVSASMTSQTVHHSVQTVVVSMSASSPPPSSPWYTSPARPVPAAPQARDLNVGPDDRHLYPRHPFHDLYTAPDATQPQSNPFANRWFDPPSLYGRRPVAGSSSVSWVQQPQPGSHVINTHAGRPLGFRGDYVLNYSPVLGIVQAPQIQGHYNHGHELTYADPFAPPQEDMTNPYILQAALQAQQHLLTANSSPAIDMAPQPANAFPLSPPPNRVEAEIQHTPAPRTSDTVSGHIAAPPRASLQGLPVELQVEIIRHLLVDTDPLHFEHLLYGMRLHWYPCHLHQRRGRNTPAPRYRETPRPCYQCALRDDIQDNPHSNPTVLSFHALRQVPDLRNIAIHTFFAENSWIIVMDFHASAPTRMRRLRHWNIDWLRYLSNVLLTVDLNTSRRSNDLLATLLRHIGRSNYLDRLNLTVNTARLPSPTIDFRSLDSFQFLGRLRDVHVLDLTIVPAWPAAETWLRNRIMTPRPRSHTLQAMALARPLSVSTIQRWDSGTLQMYMNALGMNAADRARSRPEIARDIRTFMENDALEEVSTENPEEDGEDGEGNEASESGPGPADSKNESLFR